MTQGGDEQRTLTFTGPKGEVLVSGKGKDDREIIDKVIGPNAKPVLTGAMLLPNAKSAFKPGTTLPVIEIEFNREGHRYLPRFHRCAPRRDACRVLRQQTAHRAQYQEQDQRRQGHHRGRRPHPQGSHSHCQLPQRRRAAGAIEDDRNGRRPAQPWRSDNHQGTDCGCRGPGARLPVYDLLLQAPRRAGKHRPGPVCAFRRSCIQDHSQLYPLTGGYGGFDHINRYGG